MLVSCINAVIKGVISLISDALDALAELMGYGMSDRQRRERIAAVDATWLPSIQHAAGPVTYYDPNGRAEPYIDRARPGDLIHINVEGYVDCPLKSGAYVCLTVEQCSCGCMADIYTVLTPGVTVGSLIEGTSTLDWSMDIQRIIRLDDRQEDSE
jgi:hypothetical protein